MVTMEAAGSGGVCTEGTRSEPDVLLGLGAALGTAAGLQPSESYQLCFNCKHQHNGCCGSAAVVKQLLMGDALIRLMSPQLLRWLSLKHLEISASGAG